MIAFKNNKNANKLLLLYKKIWMSYLLNVYVIFKSKCIISIFSNSILLHCYSFFFLTNSSRYYEQAWRANLLHVHSGIMTTLSVAQRECTSKFICHLHRLRGPCLVKCLFPQLSPHFIPMIGIKITAKKRTISHFFTIEMQWLAWLYMTL